jgi:hypothetical protein
MIDGIQVAINIFECSLRPPVDFVINIQYIHILRASMSSPVLVISKLQQNTSYIFESTVDAFDIRDSFESTLAVVTTESRSRAISS